MAKNTKIEKVSDFREATVGKSVDRAGGTQFGDGLTALTLQMNDGTMIVVEAPEGARLSVELYDSVPEKVE